MKSILIIALVLVVGALASAGVFMLRKDEPGDEPQARDKKMARALAVRVGLSIALFLFILFSWHMGWIQPRGIPASQR